MRVNTETDYKPTLSKFSGFVCGVGGMIFDFTGSDLARFPKTKRCLIFSEFGEIVRMLRTKRKIVRIRKYQP